VVRIQTEQLNLLTGHDIYVRNHIALFQMGMTWYYVLDLAPLIFLEYDEV